VVVVGTVEVSVVVFETVVVTFIVVVFLIVIKLLGAAELKEFTDAFDDNALEYAMAVDEIVIKVIPTTPRIRVRVNLSLTVLVIANNFVTYKKRSLFNGSFKRNCQNF